MRCELKWCLCACVRVCVCICTLVIPAPPQYLQHQCRDVRTREVGIQEIHNKVRPFEVELIRRDYTANGGWETFLCERSLGWRQEAR